MTERSHTTADGPRQRETSFQESMDAAREAVSRLAKRATSVSTTSERNKGMAAAEEALTVVRHDLAAATGRDRWVAVNTAIELEDMLRGHGLRARSEGQTLLGQRSHTRLKSWSVHARR
jgi:hypothetical protein